MTDENDRERPDEEAPVEVQEEDRCTDQQSIPFPIVGVGASAGGLECYRRLLNALPPKPGVAFVLVQHLDPSHESMMAELLNRHSKLLVTEVEDGVKIEPNHVYMIPPNKFMRVADGGLFLDEPVKRRGMRMPIDYFFRSLAEVQRERAICIVLSGTGTDGTQGLREIKAAGGMAMVQDPKTADYDGMPHSAIGTGMADFVLGIEEMPKALLDFIKQPYLASHDIAPGLSQTEPDAFRSILNLLLAQTDYDFRCYKRGTLERRIQRRMGLCNAPSASAYLRRLREDREELFALFKDLLIGVTRFFRDSEVWESLQHNVVAEIVATRGYNDPIRLWIPGCASGEEAYSIAILFFEEFERQRRSLPLQIYATDLDEDAIEIARAGRYPDSISADVSNERLEKFFVSSEQSYTVAKRVREVIVFATQNVISDPPFSRIDLISCRNLMIYLDAGIQNRLLEVFHFALSDSGYLLLGTSESVEKSAHLFERVPTVERCFRRIDTARTGRAISIETPPHRQGPPARRNRTVTDFAGVAQIESAKNVLLDTFAPASVLVDRRYQIRFFHGSLRDYLDLPKGEPEIELVNLAVEGLKGKLRVALNRAQQEGTEVEEIARRVRRNDDLVTVKIRVLPIVPRGPDREPLLVVSFMDVPKEADKSKEPPKPRDDEDEGLVNQLEYELQAVREDYQSAIEELETSNEELKASNEEVMSMNEELQSTNEELETSREELQSLNEELSTLNSQLQEKLKELESSNNDLANLLTSTEIATVFLDSQLRIRRFTPAATDLLNIIASDVGRPITDLAPKVADAALVEDCEAVLRDLQPRETDLADREGRAHLRRVRAYRTAENRIEGVVVTYSDITRLRNVMQDLRLREKQQTVVAKLGKMAMSDVAEDDLLREAVRSVAEHLNCTHAKVLMVQEGERALLLRCSVGFEGAVDGETQIPTGLDSQAGYTLREAGPVIVNDLSTEKRFSGPALLNEAGVLSGVSVLIGEQAAPWGVLGVHSTERREFTYDDVSFVQSVANLLASFVDLRRSRAERDALSARMEEVLDSANIATWIYYPESDRAYWDKRMFSLLGIEEASDELAGTRFFEFIHPDDLGDVQQRLQRSLETGETFEGEFRIRKGEETRWLGAYGKLTTAINGEQQMLGINFDVTERVRSEERLADAESRRELAVRAARLGTWEYYPHSDRYVIDERYAQMVGLPGASSTKSEVLRRRVHPDDWSVRQGRIQRTVEQGTDGSYEMEYRVYIDGSERWIRSQGQLFDGPGRTGPRLIGLAEDVTDRKRSEERQQLLMAELDHRVKNILANVNAIAKQTAYSRPDPDTFAEALEGRLAALADAHSLLSVANWSGVNLRTLIEAEVAPYTSLTDTRIQLDGDAFTLSPKAAQALCLFLHELVTNAAKHGALATEEGTLKITWTSDDETFRLDWAEEGSSGVREPERRGFGLSVIEEMTTADLRADVSLDFRDEGLRCTFEVPREEIAARASDTAVFTSLPFRRTQADRKAGKESEGLRILIVEDVWTLSRHLQSILENAGHAVVGPAARVEDGLALADVQELDAAILDIRLGNDLVFPVAERLTQLGVPFGFATGYADSDIVPEAYADRPIVSKPYTSAAIRGLIERLVA